MDIFKKEMMILLTMKSQFFDIFIFENIKKEMMILLAMKSQYIYISGNTKSG